MANTVKLINLVFRGLQFLWALLTMALVGNMIDDYLAFNSWIVNYSMFVPVFAMFTLFYLIPATVMESWSGHPIIMLTIDLLNTTFFLIGAIALPAYLHVVAIQLPPHLRRPSCDNTLYTLHNSITFTEDNREKRCREAQATCAFLWFGFVAFAGSTILSVLQIRGGANTQSGRIRLTGPDMVNLLNEQDTAPDAEMSSTRTLPGGFPHYYV